MADTDVFNVVKWQTHFQKNGESRPMCLGDQESVCEGGMKLFGSSGLK